MWPFKRKKPKVHKITFGDQVHIQIKDDGTKAILMLTEFTVDSMHGTTAIFESLTRFVERNKK